MTFSENYPINKKSWRSEAVVQRCSLKFCKIHGKTPVPESYAGLRPATLLKKRLWHRCFPVNLAKFLRTPFFIEDLWWLLLNADSATMKWVFIDALVRQSRKIIKVKIVQISFTNLFPYPLNKSENQRLSDDFMRYSKRPVTWNRLTGAIQLIERKILSKQEILEKILKLGGEVA